MSLLLLFQTNTDQLTPFGFPLLSYSSKLFVMNPHEVEEKSVVPETEVEAPNHMPGSSSPLSEAAQADGTTSVPLPRYIGGWRLHLITAPSVTARSHPVINHADRVVTGSRLHRS